MRFIRIGDETIRLDLVTHIKEGCKEETLYGRSVRKTTDARFGWLEVHFVSGEVLKIEGEGAEILRQILATETKVRDQAATAPARKLTPRESSGSEPASPAIGRPEHAPRPVDEHRGAIRNGFGR
jgi:hypothetical protein